MINNLENNPILDQALSKWGWVSQAGMCTEECGELIVAIHQYGRGRVEMESVAEEVADVLITACQMRTMAGADLVDKYIEQKLARLKIRIDI